MLFPWYSKYPYQNDEVLNLDWILKTIDNLVKEVANFVTLNTIKYADPIQWNITTQYEKNTVVIDPVTGSAYISSKPVPEGVGLNNEDYWNIIFTLDVISANKNITLRDDANNMLATFESEVDDWLLWQGTLYIVTRAIDIGQSYVDGYNLDRYTVEKFLKDYISNLKEYIDDSIDTINTVIGSLENLNTSDKSNIVAAINEVLTTINTLIGDLDDLDTTDKDNVVDAINELVSSITTTVNNINGTIGNLSDLDTTDKSSVVAAINEVLEASKDDLASLFNNIISKKILVIGDSISDESTDRPHNWVYTLRNTLNGIATVDNVSVSGRTMIALASQIDSITVSNYDYIIIEHGTNDYYADNYLGTFGTSYSSRYSDAIRKVAESIISRNVNAQIVFITPLFRTHAMPVNSRGYNMDCYRAPIVAYCRRNGLMYINGDDLPFLSSNSSYLSQYMPDGLHPNDNYSLIMSNYILHKMLVGGDKTVHFKECTDFSSFINTAITTSSPAVYMRFNPDCTISIFGSVNVQFSTAIQQLLKDPGDFFNWSSNGKKLCQPYCSAAIYYNGTFYNALMYDSTNGVSVNSFNNTFDYMLATVQFNYKFTPSFITG